MALFALQNPMDLEKVRGLYSEMCPASYDAYQAISIKVEVLSGAEEEEDPVQETFPGIKTDPAFSIKAEVLSGAEEEEDPVPLTFVGMKAEPEVSSASVTTLWDFTSTGIPQFANTQFVNFCYSEQLKCIRNFFLQKRRRTECGSVGEQQTSPPACAPTSQSL
jgi:hypothetical protein